MPLEKILATSAALATDDLDWESAHRAGLTVAERAYLGEGAEPVAAHKATFAEWRSLFGFRTTWGMILGFFGSVYLNRVYLTWLPGYLEIERHMSTIRTGFAAALNL